MSGWFRPPGNPLRQVSYQGPREDKPTRKGPSKSAPSEKVLNGLSGLPTRQTGTYFNPRRLRMRLFPLVVRQSGPFGHARRSTSPSFVRRLLIAAGITEASGVPLTVASAASSALVRVGSFAIGAV